MKVGGHVRVPVAGSVGRAGILRQEAQRTCGLCRLFPRGPRGCGQQSSQHRAVGTCWGRPPPSRGRADPIVIFKHGLLPEMTIPRQGSYLNPQRDALMMVREVCEDVSAEDVRHSSTYKKKTQLKNKPSSSKRHLLGEDASAEPGCVRV